MLIGVIPGATVKRLQPISPKSAVAVSPACVAVLLSAMAAPASPTPTDVRFAYTVAGILACKEWSWRGILGTAATVKNPNVANSHRQIELAYSSRQTNPARHRTRGWHCKVRSCSAYGTGSLQGCHALVCCEVVFARSAVTDACAYVPNTTWPHSYPFGAYEIYARRLRPTRL